MFSIELQSWPQGVSRRPALQRAILLPTILVWLIQGPSFARACASAFNNNVFPLTTEELTSAPVVGFNAELKNAGFVPSPGSHLSSWRQSELAGKRAVEDFAREMAEFEQALKQTDLPAEIQAATVIEYRAFRSIMGQARERNRTSGPRKPGTSQWPATRPRQVPAGLPIEFSLYLEGALAYDALELQSAKRAWEKLLQLPARQRRFRTIWATYMLGRIADAQADYPAAARHMLSVRDLQAQGLPDSQGLAGASVGWEARAELFLGRIERAVDLYWQLGDASSLGDAGRIAFKQPPAVLARLACHSRTVTVLNALLLSAGGPWHDPIDPTFSTRWLAALESAKAIHLAVADRLAWLAYQNGKIDLAQRWLDRANPDSLMARWLMSKMLLRAGKIDDAAQILAQLVRTWPAEEIWHEHWEDSVYPADRLTGELTMLRMHRGRFLEAMDILLRHGFFREAAYIAERVLTIKELKQYVDQHWSASGPLPPPAKHFRKLGPESDSEPYDSGNRGQTPETVRSELRYLMARRLTRLGQWRIARPYYPPPMQKVLDDYIGHIRAGHDDALSPDERAEHLWQAARIARIDGMELLGTAVEPDGAGGWERNSVPYRIAHSTGALTDPTPDERRRVLSHPPVPNVRYHYRHIAADHAWAAAQLLPDESDLKARVLCTAGNWLAARYPQSARRFYESLVRDCATTKLGRMARKDRWLPPTPNPQ